MRTNGYLTYETITEGGLDEFGEVVEAQSVWNAPVKCNIKTNSDTRKGRYEDGEFRQASYTVMVELQEITFNRLRLVRRGEDLGEFRVMTAEPLASVGRTQIVV